MADFSENPEADDMDIAPRRSVYDPQFTPPQGWDAWSEWASEQGKIARIVNTLAKAIMAFRLKSQLPDLQILCDGMVRENHLHTELTSSVRHWLVYGRTFMEPVWGGYSGSKKKLVKLRLLYPPSITIFRNTDLDIENLKGALKETEYEQYAEKLVAGNGDTIVGYIQNYIPFALDRKKKTEIIFFEPEELIFIPRYPSARHPNGISLVAQNYVLIMNKLGMEKDQAIMVKRHGDPHHKFIIPADTWDDETSRNLLKDGFKKGIKAGLDFFFRAGETEAERMDVELVEPKGNPQAVSKAIDHLENQFNAAMCWADSFNESSSSNKSVGTIQLAFFEREIIPERRLFAEILEDKLIGPWLQANSQHPSDAWFEFEDLTPEDRLQKMAIIGPIFQYLPASSAAKYLEDVGYPIEDTAPGEQGGQFSLKGVPRPVSSGTKSAREQLKTEIESMAEEIRDILG